MIEPASWEEFRDSGLLWWANRMLHTFGWAIVVELKEGEGPLDSGDEPIACVYPARVQFRGFAADREERGFRKLATHIKREFDRIVGVDE